MEPKQKLRLFQFGLIGGIFPTLGVLLHVYGLLGEKAAGLRPFFAWLAAFVVGTDLLLFRLLGAVRHVKEGVDLRYLPPAKVSADPDRYFTPEHYARYQAARRHLLVFFIASMAALVALVLWNPDILKFLL